MNKVVESIPQETKDFMRSAKEKILDSDKLRSFSAFFGMGQPKPYSLVCNPAILCGRLKDNILYFYLNYFLMAAVIFAITLFATLITPGTIIMLAVLAVVWFLGMRATSEGPLQLLGGKISLTRKTLSTIMMVISAVVIFFVAKSVFLVTLGSSASVAFIHAFFRDASEVIKSEESGNDTPSDMQMT